MFPNTFHKEIGWHPTMVQGSLHFYGLVRQVRQASSTGLAVFNVLDYNTVTSELTEKEISSSWNNFPDAMRYY